MLGQLIASSFQIYNCFGGSFDSTMLISLIGVPTILGKTASAIWRVHFGESQICTQHFGESQIRIQHLRESQIFTVSFPQIVDYVFPVFLANIISLCVTNIYVGDFYYNVDNLDMINL